MGRSLMGILRDDGRHVVYMVDGERLVGSLQPVYCWAPGSGAYDWGHGVTAGSTALAEAILRYLVSGELPCRTLLVALLAEEEVGGWPEKRWRIDDEHLLAWLQGAIDRLTELAEGGEA